MPRNENTFLTATFGLGLECLSLLNYITGFDRVERWLDIVAGVDEALVDDV